MATVRRASTENQLISGRVIRLGSEIVRIEELPVGSTVLDVLEAADLPVQDGINLNYRAASLDTVVEDGFIITFTATKISQN
jgi:hypothetical protein